mgnify:CR=1 FL=1
MTDLIIDCFSSNGRLLISPTSNRLYSFSIVLSKFWYIEYSDFNTSRLNYIYESLISYDQNLNLLPVLATSYGKIDPLTVEFKLKPNVKFHNDADLTSRNIKEIIESLKDQSNLSEILSTFESIEVIDDLTFRLVLNQEDPFVFHKLRF